MGCGFLEILDPRAQDLIFEEGVVNKKRKVLAPVAGVTGRLLIANNTLVLKKNILDYEHPTSFKKRNCDLILQILYPSNCFESTY